MSSMNDIPVPSTFNGKPTHYNLFDGFKRAGLLGKASYASCALIGVVFWPFLSVPVVMEANQWNKARNNRQDAQYAMMVQIQQERREEQPVVSPALQNAYAPDISPHSPNHFQDMANQRSVGRYR